jgi:hypothetical protein
VTSINLWNKASDAEAFSHQTFPAVLTKLAAIPQGTPKVDSYEVVNSTFHQIAANLAAAA